MSQTPESPAPVPANPDPAAHQGGDPVADRRRKLDRLRGELGVDPFGRRIDGLVALGDARARRDDAADAAFKADASKDARPVVAVSGRIVLHRDIGKLVFLTLRDSTGDLQVAVSKKSVDEKAFNLAKIADLGDVVVARGPLGTTKTGELTIWAADQAAGAVAIPGGGPGFEIATKSLAPPPEKWHGLQDAEQRYRKRYVDLYANPEVMQTFLKRSRILKRIRDFLTSPPPELGPGFVEVETPMMQSIPGGAAARPFVTHHNALDIQLYLRIAPELYLKRLLVGGMPRVFEINRNFRNEGLSVRHNPEFTMLELYQAFGDYHAMMCLTELLLNTLAKEIGGAEQLPFGDKTIDYTLPFPRVKYHEAFEKVNGFASSDHEKLVAKARALHIEIGTKDHDVLLSEVWEATVEPSLDPQRPTFVIDYPAPLCPLTRTKREDPAIAERFELYIAGMELANAYTELNDPDVQEENFRRQLSGQKEDDSMAKMDMDFVEALRVGMPPAGGLGIGIDRLVMLLTNSRSIRDVILFPLMRPQGEAAGKGETGPQGT
ncbi:MAG: lysine--tRNA ligase [Planctomycetota bacterium]|nr:lysine--tRNA ligase [Planctomycetota bacterium]